MFAPSHFFMETIFNQVVYFGFLQAIFLLLIYIFSKRKRKDISIYLIILVSVLLLGLAGRILYISEIFGREPRLHSISEFATFFFGPTVYLFTATHLGHEIRTKEALFHYIPGVFYIIFLTFYFILPPIEEIGARVATGELQRVIFIFMGTGLVVNTAYWIYTYYTYRQFCKTMNDELSYSVRTRFIQNFLYAIAACLLIWIAVYFISFIGIDPMAERNARGFIWMALAGTILFIAYYGMLYPEALQIKSLQSIQKYAQSKLSSTDLEALKQKLEHIMVQKKPYLNNSLLKAEVAELMEISNPELARVLNESIGMNFFEFINYYRIKEFLELAKTDKAKSMTFFGLAQEAGFNSKTTFYKSFKALMGSSPSEYLKGME